MDTQLKRGILEICVLKALSGGDSYGYQIIKDTKDVIGISESTLYPILKRLEGGSCVRSYSAEHNGRLRKYYAMTERGAARIEDFKREWQEIARVYEYIQGGETA